MPPIAPKERKPTTSIRQGISHLATMNQPRVQFDDLKLGMRKLFEPFMRIQEMLDELFGGNEELRQIILNILAADELANWVFAHKFTGTDMGAQINNAAESICDKDRGSFIIIQSGIYEITTPILIEDCHNLWIMGFGPSTQLFPSADFPSSTPFFQVSGVTELVLSDFYIDGLNAPSDIGPALYVDGSTNIPDISDIIFNRINIQNYPDQGISTAVSASRSIHDLHILNCVVRNHHPGGGSSKDAIHIGGPGTKERVVVSGNTVEHDSSSPTSTLDGSGHGIFVGQGVTQSVSIVGNTVEYSHGDGIILYGRQEGSETVSLSDVVVSGNVIRSPRYKGISLFGGSVVSIDGNVVRNPGTSGEADADRSGIYLSHGLTGASTKVAGANLSLLSNTIHDSDGDMVNGIHVECDSGFESSGVINGNQITGYSGLDISLIPSGQDKWVIEPAYEISMELQSDTLIVGDNQMVVFRFRLPAGYKFRLYYATLSVDTPPSGDDFTIDVRWIDVSDVDQGSIFSPATLSVVDGDDEVDTYSFARTTFESGDRLEFDVDLVSGATRPLLQLYGWLVSA